VDDGRGDVVGVLGVALERSGGDPTRNLTELIFTTVQAALGDAGCRIDDIDAIVLAAHDLVDGRSLSSMVTAPAAGAYLRDEMRVTDDGLVALSLSAAAVQSGHARRTLVAAWGRPSEGDIEAASAKSFEPFFEQPFALSSSVVSSLRATRYLGRHGAQIPQRRALVATMKERAALNPRSSPPSAAVSATYPLADDELSSMCDTVAVAVLGPVAGVARVVGIGHGTDRFGIGDRDLLEVPAARHAVDAALGQAERDIAAVDVVEIAGRSIIDEALVAEAVGLARCGHGIEDFAARPELNPSGGGAAGETPPATGLARFVETVLQLRGVAGAVQLPVVPRSGLVVAGSVVAGQTHTAVVVEAP
jgi:hypothetical protein